MSVVIGVMVIMVIGGDGSGGEAGEGETKYENVDKQKQGIIHIVIDVCIDLKDYVHLHRI